MKPRRHEEHKEEGDEASASAHHRSSFSVVPEAAQAISHKIIGCAINVHRELGPGFLEIHYENALAIEFRLNNIPYQRQAALPLTYRGESIGDSRLDLVVADQIIVELKAVNSINDVHRAQLLAYLKATGIRLGLLINFNVAVLKDGLHRIVN